MRRTLPCARDTDISFGNQCVVGPSARSHRETEEMQSSEFIGTINVNDLPLLPLLVWRQLVTDAIRPAVARKRLLDLALRRVELQYIVVGLNTRVSEERVPEPDERPAQTRMESKMLERTKHRGVLTRLQADTCPDTTGRHLSLIVDLFNWPGEVEARRTLGQTSKHPQQDCRVLG